MGTSTRRTPQLYSPSWIGHQHGEHPTSTLTRLDWGINTGKHSKTAGHGGRASQDAAATNLLLPRKSPSKHDPTSIRSRENQTAPHRGPTAIVPLPHHTPSDRVKPSNPDLSQAAFAVTTAMTQRAGASPHPPLDLLALVATQKTPHVGASPYLPQYSMLQIRFLYRRQDDE